ncbi:MAG: nitroreductase family protein [Promethearchaeota archaeon]
MEKKTSILEIIKSRRSTRRFKPDLVPNEDITAVLEAARWAPSGENSQPWKFIIIKNKETMEKIVDLLPYKKFQKFLMNGPVLIIVLGDKLKSRWFYLDCSLAVQNLMLEAWTRGLGTCFSAWYPTAPESVVIKVKEMLDIPKKWIIITMTPLGYPIESAERAFRLPATRNHLERIVCYEKFSK